MDGSHRSSRRAERQRRGAFLLKICALMLGYQWTEGLADLANLVHEFDCVDRSIVVTLSTCRLTCATEGPRWELSLRFTWPCAILIVVPTTLRVGMKPTRARALVC